MKASERQRTASILVVAACLSLLLLTTASSALGQTPPRRTCLPVSERAGREVGCWIMASEPLGQLSQPRVFWHLDRYPTRPAAEAAKGPRSTVVEALGQVWLFTIGEAGLRLQGGTRVAEIGPLPVKPGEQYTAQYMEGISNPGDVTPKHRHPGPEAWYTTAGGFCAETPDGKTVVRAGQGIVIPTDHTGWSMMTLIATGPEVRRSLVLVLHQSAHPWTAPAPEWTPKGLCKSE
ncbi:MAG: cupin domain-containing protein [Candidatus Rokuibacteriota bacterium]